MAQYEIKEVVCDWGLYEDGELILILDSAHNAHLVKRILKIDQSVPNVATPADFVEVVRCKDCKFYKTFKGFGSWCHRRIRRDIEYKTKPNDFCSYGVRKEK